MEREGTNLRLPGRRKKEKRPVMESREQLVSYIRGRMREYLEGGVPHGIPIGERIKYESQIQQLRTALHCCMYGAGGEKEYVKQVILRLLEEMELTLSERDILLPFRNADRLSGKQKFDVLLFHYMKQYGADGFPAFCDKWGLPGEVKREDGTYFEITKEDIDRIYDQEKINLTGREQLELIRDMVYEGYGHGVIDRLRDCRVDGISGGVAGVPEQFFRYEKELLGVYEGQHAYDSIFVMLRGNTVRLSFLSFESEWELRRVIKTLLRFQSPGELSCGRPYMITDMKDGSRVFACRPPFSESWAFFVRKFDSAREMLPEELIKGTGAEMLIQALILFVGSGLHIAVTGAQGSGKTTLLKALVRFINPKYNLRIEESVFELWMRREFPYRNILTFRETEAVDATEGLDAFRKTDGNCLMMGEIGTIQAAALMIELSQVSEQQLFTHHAMTTEKLIGYFKNALLRTGAYSDEQMAREQVTEAIDVHILCEKDINGNRYIREVTEITGEGKDNIRILYRYNHREMCYEKVQTPSETLLLKMEQQGEQKGVDELRKFFSEV